MSSTRFKKGHISWNTGLKISGMSGQKQSEHQKSVMRELNKKNGNPATRPEVKEKMRLAKLGKKRGSYSEEHRKNISKALKGRPTPRKGENHWKWIKDRSKLKKDDRRNDSAYGEWRRQVWLRDNFKCKIANPNCSGRIIAHHILGWASFPELRYEINNGITLCHAHHPRKRAEEKRLAPIFQELVSVSKE